MSFCRTFQRALYRSLLPTTQTPVRTTTRALPIRTFSFSPRSATKTSAAGPLLDNTASVSDASSSSSSSPSTSTPTDTSSSAPHLPTPPPYLNPAELEIYNTLLEALSPTRLEVQDVSGGCGSMYALDVVSDKFRGLSVIKQHRLVNQVLKTEIAGWHGVQLKTKAA